MLQEIDVLILILSVYHRLEIVLGERMRSEMRGFPQFQRRGHDG